MERSFNLSNVEVIHRVFGTGHVSEQTDAMFTVSFPMGEKRFIFPDAFSNYLTCKDERIQQMILDYIKEKLDEKEAQKAEQQTKAEMERNRLAQGKETDARGNKRQPEYKKENVAFKCNYCDGGSDGSGIGFKSVCSDEILEYNVKNTAGRWCSDDSCPCKKYLNGLISRDALDSYENGADDVFVCYESRMLRYWAASAGEFLTPERKGQPRKINGVQINSLAVLTTREPHAQEADRIIFGVFLVDTAYQGDCKSTGTASASPESKFKISLTLEEARCLKFWNYYRNENSLDRIQWGTGLHRYISDEQSAIILRDLVSIKQGKADAQLTQDFFRYFCAINGLDTEKLPEASGALTRG